MRLYALAEKVYAGYGDYRGKTAPIGRQIPIFRLEPPLEVATHQGPGACSVQATANAPSTPAAFLIALGDGGRCGGQNSSSSSMNSVGS